METTGFDDYEMLDAGNGRRLERFGEIILDRPAPQSLWPISLPLSEWNGAHAVYHRSGTGGGRWEIRKQVSDSWRIRWAGTVFNLKLTGFGHLGFFPEQTACWQWIRDHAVLTNGRCSVLNLFAYTGGSTVAAAKAGAEICHVDGSSGAIGWARENMAANGLQDHPVRWITDDVLKFARREVNRRRRYDGIILDPPAFGRGPKGQVWKMERDLPELLRIFSGLISDMPAFMLFTCHSVHLSAPGLSNMLSMLFENHEGSIRTGDLVIRPSHGKNLFPAGFYGCWSRKD